MPIIFDRDGLLEQVQLNPGTLIGKEVTVAHVTSVWESIGALSKRTLCIGKGVCVPRLFTLTFKVVDVKSSTAEEYTMLQRRPYLFLSDELISRHSLRMKGLHHNFDLPEIDLNLSSIAEMCHLSRENVEVCLNEIITAFDRTIVEDEQVELHIPKIAKVMVDRGTVKVSFLPKFLTLLSYSEELKYTYVSDLYTPTRSTMGDSTPSTATELDLDSLMEEEEEEIDEDELDLSRPPSTASSTSGFSMLSRLSAQTGGEDMEKTEELCLEEELRQLYGNKTLKERECIITETFLVWETISKYIIRKLMAGVAVKIAGLGTFTHTILLGDLTAGRFRKQQGVKRSRKFPLFKICPHLKDMNRLQEANKLHQCNLPIENLNVKVVANEANLAHGFVEGIITETLQAFARGVITNKNVEFPFPFIGKLHIHTQQVSMLFYEEFCEAFSANFYRDPSCISSLIPGDMTPLEYHRPSPEFLSVFHYNDIKMANQKMRASTPSQYGNGAKLIPDQAEDQCKFLEKLYLHSNLLFKCRCLKCGHSAKSRDSIGKKISFEMDEDTESGTDERKYSSARSHSRSQDSCMTQPVTFFTFQQPDGSTFTPEPLYSTGRTGNPLLDRLTNDLCFSQQVLGCWLKQEIKKNLGPDTISKHYDRNYFKKLGEAEPTGIAAWESCVASEEPTSVGSPKPESEKDMEERSRLGSGTVKSASVDTGRSKFPSISIRSAMAQHQFEIPNLDEMFIHE